MTAVLATACMPLDVEPYLEPEPVNHDASIDESSVQPSLRSGPNEEFNRLVVLNVDTHCDETFTIGVVRDDDVNDEVFLKWFVYREDTPLPPSSTTAQLRLQVTGEANRPGGSYKFSTAAQSAGKFVVEAVVSDGFDDSQDQDARKVKPGHRSVSYTWYVDTVKGYQSCHDQQAGGQ